MPNVTSWTILYLVLVLGLMGSIAAMRFLHKKKVPLLAKMESMSQRDPNMYDLESKIRDIDMMLAFMIVLALICISSMISIAIYFLL